MDVYVARQPIFDRKKSLFAYELLFRDGLDNYMPKLDGDAATTKLLSSSFFTIGIDKIGAGKRAFINFTQKLLETDIPLMFPRETTVVEILEDVNPDPDLLEACKRLSSLGYYLALDDFVFKLELKPLIELADVIKIDFRITPVDEIKKILKTLGTRKIKFLAEKVETNEEFKNALNMGFQFFQGYFFSKPEIIKGREISSSSLQYLNFMMEINKPQYSLSELETIMSRDISMSYKLLRYVNSAFYKRSSDITSLRQALLILGKDEINRFIALIGLSKLAAIKPEELVTSACIKAKLCEKLGSASSCGATRDELFLLGLFSNLDAILDLPMEEVMEKLPLSAPIKEALITRSGILGDFLTLAESYEQGNWDKVKEFAAKSCVVENAIPNMFLEACAWASEFGL
ncbi:MAG: HDOD domain-containing protein [Dissulfurispiraceae bacterium]|jgi:EAL and modified HD-GYP domain-containing signal transduction protein